MKKLVLIAVSALFTASTFAQRDSLNAVVKVENDYNPIIVKAAKHSFTPQIELPTDNTPLDLVFSRSATPYERFVSNRDLSGLLPGQEPADKGYVRLGYGNRNNADAKFGYRLDLGKDDTINLFASLTGFNCNIDGVSVDNWDSRFYNTWLTADYTHRFSGLTFDLLGGVNSNVFNYQPVSGFSNTLTDKQNSNDFRILARVKSELAGPFSYSARLGYQLHTRKYSAGVEKRTDENMFSAGGEIAFEINNEQLRQLGMAVDFDAFTYNDAMKPAFNEYEDYASIRFNPFLNFCFNDWKLRLGIHADLLTANGKKAVFAPDVRFEGPVSEDISFYTSITGGNSLNSFSALSELSPYWLYTEDGVQYTPTYKVFDVEAGLRMGFEPLAIHLFTGYDYIKYNLLPIVNDNDYYGLLYTAFAQDDTRKYYLGGDLSFDYSGWFNMTADIRYNKWSCDGNDEFLLFTPILEASIKARARLYEGLYFGLGYDYARYTKGGAERIKDMNNFNANISYRFHEQFRVYLQGDNLFNQNYFSYAGYKARGLNFIAGLEFNF